MWRGDGLKSSILGGALLLTATNLLLRLISIGFNVFLSYRIGAEGLGLLQLIGTIGAFALLLGTSGIRTSAMYLAAEEFGHRRTGGVKQAMRACLRYGLLVSTVAGLGLMLLSGRIASTLLRDERATLSLWVMGLLLPFSCLCGIMTGYYTACGRIRQLVGIEIAERLISVALTLLLLLCWTDARRACCAITLGSSLGCVFDFFLLYARYRRDVRHVHASQGAMTPRLLRLCVPLALNDYLRAGLTTAEQLLIPYGLSRWGSSSARALADYGTIHAMVFPILMFPAALLYALADLLVPELSRCLAMGRTLRVRDLTGKCLRLTMLFSCLIAGFRQRRRTGHAHLSQCRRGTLPSHFCPDDPDAISRRHHRRDAQGACRAAQLRALQHVHLRAGRRAAVSPSAQIRRGGLRLHLHAHARDQSLSECPPPAACRWPASAAVATA